MIVWGRSSDRTNERRWHTALTLFMIAAGVFAAFINLAADYHCYSQYHINWRLFGEGAILGAGLRLDEQHLSRRGLAAIGAIANLIGGVVMVNAYGVISEQTGSHTLAMLPLAGLCPAGGIAVLIMGRRYSQPAGQENRSPINKQRRGFSRLFNIRYSFIS